MKCVNSMKTGAYFGHRALDKSIKRFGGRSQCTRDARIVAVTDCRLAVLTQDNYAEFLQKNLEKRAEIDLKFLASVPYMDHMPPYKRKEFHSKMKGNIYRAVKGQTV